MAEEIANDALAATMRGIAEEALEASAEAAASADELEAEAQRVQRALKLADDLAALVVERAQSEELSTHVEISFEPDAAAMIANMADAYQRARSA